MGNTGSRPARRSAPSNAKPAPPPPTVKEDPYPVPGEKEGKITNLSVSSSVACIVCDMMVDTGVSISSVKLSRDIGAITRGECSRYDADRKKVQDNQLSFQDFLTNVQSGMYSIPVSKTEKGAQNCQKIMLSEEDAAAVKDLATFDAKPLKRLRIRPVSGLGSFSSGTKAKYTFSIPVNIKYVSDLVDVPAKMDVALGGSPPTWKYTYIPAKTKQPVFDTATISTMTLYHPSPVRIENVQHDAVLSLNDPSDDNVTMVVLIPLKGSNTGSPSEDFFSRIAKHVISIAVPDSVTGAYQQVDIPTGSGWGLKQLFTIAPDAKTDAPTNVNDAFYTWTSFDGYERYEKSRTATEILYGWKSTGKKVRYFMLANPISISLTDLSLITRNLPPTPPEEAIHAIPDPAKTTNSKMLYKRAEGNAVCGGVRESMANPGDPDMCDPFAMNAQSDSIYGFSPTQIMAVVFNVLLAFGVAIGVWVAMYMITIDYDVNYKNFAQDAGKVVGTLAKQTTAKVAETKDALSDIRSMFNPSSNLPALKSLVNAKRAQ